MKNSTQLIGRYHVAVYEYNTVIVGTGAAGFNAADCLYSFGQKDIAILSEHVSAGTSRNTGSDKQTYYKLSLSGNEPDSIRKMANTLFAGQCVDGDLALCEAALSAKCFFKLVEKGIKFPQNKYGEYVGYKTDHDPHARGTTVGPFTSRQMTEQLEKSVKEKNIDIYDGMQVIQIETKEGKVKGLICLRLDNHLPLENRFAVFCCKNVIYATGGPAGIYANSVYPHGQYGASGIAFEAGIKGKNLTEWQYGIASRKPRWNVSGSYMQALPRFISTDTDGGNEREFLNDLFPDRSEMLTKIFLKGYQWPFDINKLDGGSSVIDILVYMESCKNRKVFLDFRKNPGDEAVDFSSLGKEAYGYLNKAGACLHTPYERLQQLNMPAAKFYAERGVDLSKEPLGIALCAQHNNGGLAVDCWWQTNIEGFFAVGEACGSHGVYRPGGSALNAGQAGALRAAQYIAAKGTGQNVWDQTVYAESLQKIFCLVENALGDHDGNAKQLWRKAARLMSEKASAIREKGQIEEVLQITKHWLDTFSETIRIKSSHGLTDLFHLRDALLCQSVYLQSMLDYIEQGGKSRGSALYLNRAKGKPVARLPAEYSFQPDNGEKSNMIQEVLLDKGKCVFIWREVRPIPTADDFFENVWREYRENNGVY